MSRSSQQNIFCRTEIFLFTKIFRDFQYAANTGTVTLQTMPGLNFFFTPLGKSFVCRLPEDQGPMKLYNVARYIYNSTHIYTSINIFYLSTYLHISTYLQISSIRP